jgi:1-acyl-sn-glycerol-3-phosphate acyltransferase
MHATIFDNPILGSFLTRSSQLVLKLIGWQKEGTRPEESSYVLIAAPHTSNWDMPITMFLAFSFGIKVYWFGKDSLFKRPFGSIMKWLGGIPIERNTANDMVNQTIQAFQKNENLVITIPPEGTRGKVTYWKTGFYHIAYGAGVPIALGFLDYQQKKGGFGPMLYPTGDIQTDMEIIKAFYAPIQGKFPKQSGDASVRSQASQAHV